MLSLERLNRIREIRPEARVAVVEAGVVLETLHEAARAFGLAFPLTFGAKGSAMIGGAMSTNAGGSNVLRYGNTRALVLGLEAVLPDGAVLDLMSALHKDNSGYDLRDLLIGAEGTLGDRSPPRWSNWCRSRAPIATAMVSGASLDDALALLNRLQAETGGAVEAFEYMPRRLSRRACRRCTRRCASPWRQRRGERDAGDRRRPRQRDGDTRAPTARPRRWPVWRTCSARRWRPAGCCDAVIAPIRGPAARDLGAARGGGRGDARDRRPAWSTTSPCRSTRVPRFLDRARARARRRSIPARGPLGRPSRRRQHPLHGLPDPGRPGAGGRDHGGGRGGGARPRRIVQRRTRDRAVEEALDGAAQGSGGAAR